MPSAHRSLAGTALLAALAVGRTWLEARLPAHLLVLVPGLVASGALMAAASARVQRLGSRVDPLGIAQLLAGTLVCAWAMLPRTLDAAIADPAVELARWVLLPAAGGLALAPAWRRLPPLARAFVLANVWSMLLLAGWLYLALPVRLCSYYLASDQALVGRALLTGAAVFAAWFAVRALAGIPAGQGAPGGTQAASSRST